jgi:3-hydroxy acid dehydrogenase/malonic semialdehyde reductase
LTGAALAGESAGHQLSEVMVMRLRRLEEGAIALVTGASSGIGAATVEQLVARGGKVIAAARRRDRLAALAERLGPSCLPLELDVADAGVAGVAGVVERLPAGWRDIDILINNAGHDVGGKVPFERGAAADWAAIVETNVTGMVRMSHAVIPGMLARSGGQIVNLGSTSGVNPIPTDAVYSASKFAVNGLSKALRLEYLGKLRVIQILPGLVRTEFDESRKRGDRQSAAGFYDAASGYLLPEDVAAAIVFAVTQPARANVAELLLLPAS